MSTLGDQWTRPRPDATGLLRDLLLGLGLAALAVVTAELVRSTRPGIDMGWRGVEGYLWSVAIVLPLCVRRRYPVLVMVACAALFFVIGERLQEMAFSLTVQAAPFIAIYTAWAWSRHRRRVSWWTALVFTGMFVWLVFLLLEPAVDMPSGTSGLVSAPVAVGLQTFMVNILYFFGAMAWGLSAWRGARQRAELQLQTEELAVEQAANARRAVADERVRIARDLHDVVAHHVSSIGVHAAGARRLVERDADASQQALRVIEGSSRQAVQEMHQIVSLLRVEDASGSAGGEPDARRTPQPGLADLDELVDRARADGVSVTLRESGTPFDVPATVSLSLYRTAQESLVNVRKHAPGARAEVVLRYIPGDDASQEVEVEVIDDGRAAGGTADPATPGWGLTGIRERAALHGGSTEIGPRPDGGYRVRVRMPTTVTP